MEKVVPRINLHLFYLLKIFKHNGDALPKKQYIVIDRGIHILTLS
jgi:hypothetical protein